MQKTLAIYILVLLILGASYGLGSVQTRVVRIADIALDPLPADMDGWKCVSHQRPDRADKNTEEALMETYVYQNAAGQKLSATLQVTSSRLGVLRDWPTAQVGQGWTVGPSTPVTLQADGMPAPLVANGRWLVKARTLCATMTWFVSPTSQASSLAKAEVLGWRDQILGKALWGGLYVQAGDGAGPEALWGAAADFTRVAGPHFRAILLNTHAG